ncbi:MULTISPECIES: hypothetical protein [unclassified Streptomyces]|uniref:hypothetical protein n=1 Tax=unclassified Streptomyces TaxID=2593676 RepID=UPI003798201C
MHRSIAPVGPAAAGTRSALSPPCEEPGPLEATHVPFIALTAGEGHLDFSTLEPGDDGWITYATPGPYDRYPDMDVLLARTDCAAPSGQPDGNVLCPYRQAHCMLNRLCQGCGEPAEHSDRGVLYVLPATRRDGSPAVFRGLSDMPPSCARCALRRCPVLTDRGRKLLWVAQAEVIGVYAELFSPGHRGSLPDRLVRFDEERKLSGAVATRFVCDLRRVAEAIPSHIAELARRRPATAAPRGAGRPARPGPIGTRPASAVVAEAVA